MSLSETDFSKLYLLQDKFLSWWATLGFRFYLTGGTALGRFYLQHRYSEDLDFFVNNDAHYNQYIRAFRKLIPDHFQIDMNQALFTDDFARFFISDGDISLKVELINDVGYYAGNPVGYKYGLIDTPLNILANKLLAVTGRDEPKDICDILHIAYNYRFNWREIFIHAKQKAVVNELDIAQRLSDFPTDWLSGIKWIISPSAPEIISKHIRTIADDFLLGADNSLGAGRIPIEKALPLEKYRGSLS